MIVQLILFCVCVASAQEWSYRDQNNWSQNFRMCGGRRQSPININTNQMKANPSMRIQLKDYDRQYKNLNIRNDGHTVYITLNKQSVKPTAVLSSGRDSQTYVFEQMHFHWGDDNFKGSEHSIDRVFGASELHLVHYNKRYGSLAKARERKDGILVLTVLLPLSREDNRSLNPIIKALPRIIQYNSSSVINGLNLDNLLPQNTKRFFKYEGSLTTPPCSESVTFVIFAETTRISANQVSQFRRLLDSSKKGRNERIIDNKRNLQKINGREVEVSVPGRRNGINSGRGFDEEGRGPQNDIDFEY